MNKTVEEKLNELRQYRALQIIGPGSDTGKRFDTEFYVEGYATTFERYVLYEDADGPIYELFTPDAFKMVDMSDVIFQLNHEGMVYARITNKTLALEVDGHGLKTYVDLSKTSKSRGLHEDIQSGNITKMSWGFRLGEYEYDRATRTIIHKSIKKIYDVSAVSIPANNGTEISARSFVSGELERIRGEHQKREALLLDLEIELIKGK